MSRRSYTLIVLLVCYAISNAKGDDPTELEEWRPCLEWLHALGLPSADNSRYVHVSQGNSKDYFGCLLWESEHSFVVYTDDFRQIFFTKGSISNWAKAATFKEIAFTSLPEIYKHQFAANSGRPSGHLLRPFRAVSDRAVLLHVAYVSSECGHPLVAEALATMAKRRFYGGFHKFRNEPTLLETLQDSISAEMAQRVLHNFGDLNYSRRELLTQLRWLVDHCPPEVNDVSGKLAELIDVVSIMIAEDQYGSPPPKGLESEIRTLIRSLRDQNGKVTSPREGCDIFDNSHGSDSAAHKLVTYGTRAIPFLIEALDDQNLTRSVHYNRNCRYPQVLRVGDCAALILYEIIGESFRNEFPGIPHSLDVVHNDTRKNYAQQRKRAKARIARWWSENDGRKQDKAN